MRGKNILRPGQAFPDQSFWQSCREKTATQDSFGFKRFFVSERGNNCPPVPLGRQGLPQGGSRASSPHLRLTQRREHGHTTQVMGRHEDPQAGSQILSAGTTPPNLADPERRSRPGPRAPGAIGA